MKNNTNKFFITTAIPYVNAKPHIGFAMELILTDVLARWHRLQGDCVFFLTGTDDNSLKNVQAALAAGKETETFVNENAALYQRFTGELSVSNDDFIRTREERHVRGAQKLWAACNPDDIYKKKYAGLYCVGCEAYYKEDELENGLCPEHRKPLEKITEENYFFQLSKYQKQLEKLIASDAIKIIPEKRKNEVLSFIRSGLDDFSVSRSQERARGWGVPVPGDASQVMYVWFDALSNYINAAGYADDPKRFDAWWQKRNGKVVHVIGKGIIRFHAVYWPAMLLSAGVKLFDVLVVHDYVTHNGEKMSKSLGNVIDPFGLIEQYGVDAVRSYFSGGVPTFEDGDYSEERFKAWYSSELANGIGNVSARILTLAEKYGVAAPQDAHALAQRSQDGWQSLEQAFSAYEMDRAYRAIQSFVQTLDQTIEQEKPWSATLDKNKRREIIGGLLEGLRHLAWMIQPFLPATAEKMLEQIIPDEAERAAEKGKSYNKKKEWGGIGSGYQVKKGDNLFPRLDSNK